MDENSDIIKVISITMKLFEAMCIEVIVWYGYTCTFPQIYIQTFNIHVHAYD